MTRAGLGRARRIVVKVGTGLLAPPAGGVHTRRFSQIARDISALLDEGREVVLVTSGAVGLGQRRLGRTERPLTLPEKQAAAAIGQIDLCRRYERSFAKNGYLVGQILLTHAGLSNRERFLRARRTFQELLAKRVVPLVNENDSVATEELRFGDNDRLAALVVNASGADLLILLTDVDGLYDRPPREGPGTRIPEVERVNKRLLARTDDGSGSPGGSGGMRSKLESAQAAARFGVPTVIAGGRRAGVLTEILAGRDVGTLVHPARERLSARKHWIAFSPRPRGSLEIDAGAERALRERGRSLLPAGVVRVRGEFRVGDLVRCLAPGGQEVARGLVAYSADEIRTIRGQRTSQIPALLGYSNGNAVIHRDDLVIA